MRQINRLIALAALSAVAAWGQAAPAQTPQSPGQLRNLCSAHFLTPKPGATKALEAGMKAHIAWHAKNTPNWRYNIYQVVNGERIGNYVATSCGHGWADFDEYQKLEDADNADVAANIAPHTAHISSAIYAARQDMSLTDMTQMADEPQFSQVTIFTMKPGAAPAFAAAVQKVKEHQIKANRPRNSVWLQLLNGGEPHFVLIVARKNWADFAGDGGPGPRAVTDAAMGAEASAALWKEFNDSISRSESEVAMFRKDLSSAPAAKAAK